MQRERDERADTKEGNPKRLWREFRLQEVDQPTPPLLMPARSLRESPVGPRDKPHEHPK